MACKQRCKESIYTLKSLEKVGSTELPGVSQSFWDDRFLHLPENASASKKAQGECIRRSLKRVGTFLRKRDLPGWYRALSKFQIRSINELHKSLTDDYDQLTIHRTVRCIRQLGLHPQVSPEDLRVILELSKANDLAFLWFLMERHYQKKKRGVCHEKELDDSRQTYNINEQLIMSAISHLDMVTTMRELEKVLPPPQPPGYGQRKKKQGKEQKAQLNDNKCRKPTSGCKYILPYFSKLTCPVLKIPKLTAKPKDMKVFTPFFAKSKNPDYHVRNEETRWYANCNPNNIKDDIARVYEGFKSANLSDATVEKLRKRHREIENLQTSLHDHLSKIAEEKFNAYVDDGKLKSTQEPRERIMSHLEKEVELCMEDFRKTAERSRKQFIQTTLIKSRLDTYPLIKLKSYMRYAGCEIGGRDGDLNHNACACRPHNQDENCLETRNAQSFYFVIPESDFVDDTSHSDNRCSFTPGSGREDTSSLCTEGNQKNRKKKKKSQCYRKDSSYSSSDVRRKESATCVENPNGSICPPYYEPNTYSLASEGSTFPSHEKYHWNRPASTTLKALSITKEEDSKCTSDSSLAKDGENIPGELKKSNSQVTKFQQKYFPIDCVRESSEILFNYSGPGMLHTFNYERIFHLKDSEETLRLRRAFIDAIDSDVALLNKLSDQHITDKAINECVSKMKCSLSKAIQNEKPKHPLGFDEDYYDPDDESLMIKMLQIALKHISQNPKFVGASLPESYKLPLLREFISLHFGKRYTVDERETSLEISKRVFYALEKLDFFVRRPSYRGGKLTQLVDYSHRDRLVALGKKMRRKFNRSMDKAMLSKARIYWFAMRPLLCVGGSSDSTFFAYLPTRMGDTQHFKVYKQADVQTKSILYR
uniref:Uncharacterized protein n=1 Tax=Glossina palpalis gambiensis TaxID=67801 RepID=A0A1B0BZB2_9MUSC